MLVEPPPIVPGRTALVLNDMINANLRGPDHSNNDRLARSGLIERAAEVVIAVRNLSIPIFWIRVERRADRLDVVDTLTDHYLSKGARQPIVAGSRDAANIDELPVVEGDYVVNKPRIDPFIGTNLDLALRTRGRDTILLGGYATNIGVESCARTARDLNYNVVVLGDCCQSYAEDVHRWSIDQLMPRFGRVMTGRQALTLLGAAPSQGA